MNQQNETTQPDEFERRFDELFEARFDTIFEARFDALYDRRREDERTHVLGLGSVSGTGKSQGFEKGLGSGKIGKSSISKGYGSFDDFGAATSYGSLNKRSRKASVEVARPLEIDAKLAQRFNAYAAEAFPREIGGMLRIVEDEGVWRVIDMKIFPHLAASGAYFELDGQEVARFLTSLALEGRKDEIGEWRGLVHSHPNMRPFMSGTDYENLKRLCGKKWAFSLICSAGSDPSRNYFAVHYAQAQPWPLVIEDLPVKPVNGKTLAGVEMLDDDELAEIVTDVRAVLGNAKRSWWNNRSGAAQSTEESEDDTAPRQEDDLIDIAWSDSEYRIIEVAINEAKENAETLSTTKEQLEWLRERTETNDPLSCDELQLLSLVLTYRHQTLEEANNGPDDTRLGALERLGNRVDRRLESMASASAEDTEEGTEKDAGAADEDDTLDLTIEEHKLVVEIVNWSIDHAWQDNGEAQALREQALFREPLTRDEVQLLQELIGPYAEADEPAVLELQELVDSWLDELQELVDSRRDERPEPFAGPCVFADEGLDARASGQDGADADATDEPYPAATAVSGEDEPDEERVGSMA